MKTRIALTSLLAITMACASTPKPKENIIATLAAPTVPVEPAQTSSTSLESTTSEEFFSPVEILEALVRLNIAATEAKIKEALEATPPNFREAKDLAKNLPIQHQKKWELVMEYLGEERVAATWDEEICGAEKMRDACQEALDIINEAGAFIGKMRHVTMPVCKMARQPEDQQKKMQSG